MNRIPTIAAAIALIALVLAGYLALSSRISRLEEALDAARLDAGHSVDANGEFTALGYAGRGSLRLQLSARLAAVPLPSPFATPRRSETASPVPPARLAAPTADEAVQAAPIAPAELDEPGWFARLRQRVGGSDEPTQVEIEAGVREALNAGVDAALGRLGQPGGYAKAADVSIELPQKLEAVRSVLNSVGMATLMDELRDRLNRAAELAATDARAPLQEAIADLPLDDPSRLQGADDAATSYLRSRMTGRLMGQLRPLMDRRLQEVGAYALYQQALGIYSALPFVPAIEGDLARYTTARSLDGIFRRLGDEERRLRANPERHTTVALRAAFGSSNH